MASSVIERMRYSHPRLKKEIDHDQDIQPLYETIVIPGTLTSKSTMCLNVDISESESLIEVVLQCRYIRRYLAMLLFISPVHREHCRCWSSLADKFPLKQNNVVHQIKQDFIHRFLTYVKYKVLIHGSACRRKYNKNWFAFLNDKGVYRARWFIVYTTGVCVKCGIILQSI